MSKSPWKLDEVEKRLQQTKEVLPAEIANVSQSYFESSWRKQGYDGKKWKEVKRRLDGKGGGKGAAKTRAILVKSGRLRRSFHVLSKRWDNITVANSAPYAKVHNEGFKGIEYVKPHRRFVYQGDKIGSGIYSIKTRREKKVKVKIKQDVKGFSRKMNLPQRQFMGQTNELGQKQIRIINKAFDDIWR